MPPHATLAHVVFVTGPSGAGRSTVINTLEDLGFEAIDNLPLSLLPRLLEGAPPPRPLALCIDPRTRDFDAHDLIHAYEKLEQDPAYDAELVYIDCDPATLQRRYSETRRRHPMAPDADPADGIAMEREMLAPLRSRADVLIDTTTFTVHRTRDEVLRLFALDRAPAMAIQIMSFSYRRALPVGADLVFDCRFLRNPHWDPNLRAKDGRDASVQSYVAQDERFAAFRSQINAMLDLLIPAFKEEGKSHLTVAFGCTGGRHRSVTMAEMTASRLAEEGWQVSKRHRDVDKNAAHNGGTGNNDASSQERGPITWTAAPAGDGEANQT